MINRSFIVYLFIRITFGSPEEENNLSTGPFSTFGGHLLNKHFLTVIIEEYKEFTYNGSIHRVQSDLVLPGNRGRSRTPLRWEILGNQRINTQEQVDEIRRVVVCREGGRRQKHMERNV